MHCKSETPKKCTGNLIEVEIVGNTRKVIRGNSSGSKGLTLKPASPLFPHVHFHLQLRFPFCSYAFLVRIREKNSTPCVVGGKATDSSTYTTKLILQPQDLSCCFKEAIFRTWLNTRSLYQSQYWRILMKIHTLIVWHQI